MGQDTYELIIPTYTKTIKLASPRRRLPLPLIKSAIAINQVSDLPVIKAAIALNQGSGSHLGTAQ